MFSRHDDQDPPHVAISYVFLPNFFPVYRFPMYDKCMTNAKQTRHPDRIFRELAPAAAWADEFELQPGTTLDQIALALGKVAATRGEHYRAILLPASTPSTLERLRYPVAENRTFQSLQWEEGSQRIANELGVSRQPREPRSGIRAITYKSGSARQVEAQAAGFLHHLPHAKVSITTLFDAYGASRTVADMHPAVVVETEAASFHDANEDIIKVYRTADEAGIGRFSVENFMHGDQGTIYTVQTRHFC